MDPAVWRVIFLDHFQREGCLQSSSPGTSCLIQGEGAVEPMQMVARFHPLGPRHRHWLVAGPSQNGSGFDISSWALHCSAVFDDGGEIEVLCFFRLSKYF